MDYEMKERIITKEITTIKNMYLKNVKKENRRI